MWIVEDRFRVRLGGNDYVNVPTLVAFRGESLFTFKRHDDTGYLGIYFDIFDEEGKHIAAVRRNEIYFGDKEKYQIEGALNRYIFLERKSQRVICDIKKREEAHPAELDVSVSLYTPTGFLFNATPEETNLRGIVLRNNLIADCKIGIAIE
jgi:hypothetical protein